MSFRDVVFWVHLLCGVVAGLVIAIMSLTGVAIAFEPEILAWLDREVAAVEVPASGRPLTLDALVAGAAARRPDFRTTTVLVPRDPTEAYTFLAGRSGSLYLDPFTGGVSEPRSGPAHDLLHALEEWHRWLGLEGRGRAWGKLVNGVCNLALLVLCVTGPYLWLPRRFGRAAFRPLLAFVPGLRGRARDLNWHNVVGVWSAPVLGVLAATGVVFSFEWGHELVFALAGEEAPAARGPGMLASPPVALPSSPSGATVLPLAAIHARVAALYPRHETIGFNLPAPGTPEAPLSVVVFEPAAFATRGRVQLQVDPYRGEVLSAVGWRDRSPGTRARIWVRFLHTGEAFGMPGRIAAVLATAASLLLACTGLALSWRRWRAWRRR